MTPLAGPAHAAALVLTVAGIAKLLRPTGTVSALAAVRLPGSRVAARGLGAVEAAVGVAVLAGLGWPAAVAAAGLHIGFAAVAWVLARRAANCGCFGVGAPVTEVHVVTALVAAGVFVAAAFVDVPSLAAAVDATPAAGVPYAALVGLLAAGEVLCLTALPEAQVAARALATSR